MRANYVVVFLLGMGLLLVSSPALVAHHSLTAEFDSSKPVEFDGVVKKVDWMNPHIYTQVETKGPDGKMVVYRIEGSAPNALYRNGWRPDSLKIGDSVHVKGIRAKSPTSMNIGQAQITSADGKPIFR